MTLRCLFSYAVLFMAANARQAATGTDMTNGIGYKDILDK